MYHESVIIPDTGAKVRAYMTDDIPVVAIADAGGTCNEVKIQLPRRMSAAEQSTWLRTLAAQLEELAEQVDQIAGAALADQHIADAKAAAGIGGA